MISDRKEWEEFEMLSFICLILGIVYIFKRPGIAKTDRSVYPGASQADFDEWKRAELSSIDVFLLATWGQSIVFIAIGLLLSVFTAQSGGRSAAEEFGGILTIAQTCVFLLGIIASAVIGSRAQKLKTALTTA
jgi:hypothetical protein